MSDLITTTNPLHEKALAIIAAELELEPSDLTLTGHLVDDYDADSLALIAMVSRFEKELGVPIPRSELPELVDLLSIFAKLDLAAESAGV